ncbi:MAG: hypothetical protein ACOC0M_00310 [Halomonas sp.]
MAQQDYSYIGKGRIFAGKRSGGGLLPVGNCSALTLTAEETKQELPDYTTPGGGTRNSVSRISRVGMSMTAHDLSPQNLAMAYRGTVNEVDGGTSVTDERHTAYVGGLVAFDDMADISDTQLVVVTRDPDGTASALVEGTDYTVTNAGIEVLEGGAVEDGDTLGIDYPRSAQTIMEALTDAGAEYKLVFDGLNEAQSGQAVVITAHRCKFSPTSSGFPAIGDEFAEMTIEGDVLIDTTVTGTGLSQFFRVAMANKAA